MWPWGREGEWAEPWPEQLWQWVSVLGEGMCLKNVPLPDSSRQAVPDQVGDKKSALTACLMKHDLLCPLVL